MQISKLILCSIFGSFLVSCQQNTHRQNFESREGMRDLSKYTVHYRVISLENSPRRQGINTQFASINQYAQVMKDSLGFEHQAQISFQYIDAILGKNLDRATLAANGLYLGGLSNGELGLVVTTLKHILPQATALQDSELMVVLEDDVVLPNDLPMSLSFALKEVPADADMLYLGCYQGAFSNVNGSQKSPFYPQTASKAEGFSGDLCPQSSLHQVPGTAWKKMNGGCVAGTWAYALTSKNAEKLDGLLKRFLPVNGRYPIDEMYRILVERGEVNTYCLSPELVRPNYATPSTIRD